MSAEQNRTQQLVSPCQKFVSTLNLLAHQGNFAVQRIDIQTSLDTNENGQTHIVQKPVGFTNVDDLSMKTNGAFILRHPQKGSYLVQFESACNQASGQSEALVRKIPDQLEPQQLEETSTVLPNEHLLFQAKQCKVKPAEPKIDLSGDDKFLEEIAKVFESSQQT